MYSKIKDLLARTENTLPARTLLALGLILLVTAQIYFETREPLGERITGAVIWNAVYNLEIVNYNNVWSALPFLFGGILLWLLFGNFQWDMPSRGAERRSNLLASRGLLREERPRNTCTARKCRCDAIIQLLIIAALYAYLIFRIAQQSKTILEPFLWMFAIAWLTLLIWNWERKHVDLAFDFNASDLTAILILLVIGIAVGAFALTDLPKQIVRDELPFWQASRLIASGGYHASIFEVGVFTFPLFTTIYQSWVMRIFGITFWAWRFSSVLAGVVTVMPLYLLARNWFDRRVAFAAGLIMLVNPYFLSFSRFGYNNIHSLFPVALAIYLWEKGIRRNSIFYLWLGGLAAGLGYYSFFSAWIGVVVLGLSIFYLCFCKQISRKQVLVFLAVLIIAFTLMAAPRVVFAVGSGRSDALSFKVFQASFINAFYGRFFYSDSDLTSFYPFIDVGMDQPIFFNPQIYGELFVRGVIRTFLAMVDPYIATEHFLVSGFAGVVTPIFFVIGFILALKNWKQSRVGLLLLWFFSGTVFLAILNAFPPRQTHLVAIIPALAILSALGLISTIDQLVRQDFPRKIISALALLVIVFLSLYAFFIKLSIVYPADFENQSAWLARREDVHAAIVYAGPMEDQHLVSSLIGLQIVQAQYLAIPGNIAVQVTREYVNTPTLIFYEGRDENSAREIEAMGFRNSVVYKNKDILGYAFTNTDINLSPDTGLSSEWILFLKSPASIVLGILLGALCLHLVNERYCIVKLFSI